MKPNPWKRLANAARRAVATRHDRRPDEVDAVLVTRLPNVRYLTGFTGSSGQILVTPSEAVPPSCSASAARSIGLSRFTTPFLLFEPLSAVAENWPLVRPYTPLFSTI